MQKMSPPELGQVFTPPGLAGLMSRILLERIPITGEILDPCCGKNIFALSLDEAGFKGALTAIEIDDSLIDERMHSYFAHPGRTLIKGNFLDLSTTQKFDGLIMNPPYVRHEDLNTGPNNKEKLRSKVKGLPARSNLYAYFVLKAAQHLRAGGRMVAVTYDSWLYSSFGKDFKKSLNQLGSISSVLHVSEKAFVGADVGATIIVFDKSLKKEPRFAVYKSYLEVPVNPKKIAWTESSSTDPQIKNGFTTLEKLSDKPIVRGTSAIVNKYFVLDRPHPVGSIPFVKSVKNINSLDIGNDYSYLLQIQNPTDFKARRILAEIEKSVMTNQDKNRTLRRMIESKRRNWYTPRLSSPGNILFNYYIRGNPHFLLNDELRQSSDNFYNLYFSSYLNAKFAVLNSSLVLNEIFRRSRVQGGGLRKLQLYEFKLVPVPNVNSMPRKTLDQLDEFGLILRKLDRSKFAESKIREKIDMVLTHELQQ